MFVCLIKLQTKYFYLFIFFSFSDEQDASLIEQKIGQMQHRESGTMAGKAIKAGLIRFNLIGQQASFLNLIGLRLENQIRPF